MRLCIYKTLPFSQFSYLHFVMIAKTCIHSIRSSDFLSLTVLWTRTALGGGIALHSLCWVYKISSLPGFSFYVGYSVSSPGKLIYSPILPSSSWTKWFPLHHIRNFKYTITIDGWVEHYLKLFIIISPSVNKNGRCGWTTFWKPRTKLTYVRWITLDGQTSGGERSASKGSEPMEILRERIQLKYTVKVRQDNGNTIIGLMLVRLGNGRQRVYVQVLWLGPLNNGLLHGR